MNGQSASVSVRMRLLGARMRWLVQTIRFTVIYAISSLMIRTNAFVTACVQAVKMLSMKCLQTQRQLFTGHVSIVPSAALKCIRVPAVLLRSAHIIQSLPFVATMVPCLPQLLFALGSHALL